MQLDFEKIFFAEVIDNKDPLEQGRVQIYVSSLMWGWTSNHMPWARPFFNATGSSFSEAAGQQDILPIVPARVKNMFTFGQSFIPEIGTKIWVWFENIQYYKNPYYISGVSLASSNPHKTFSTYVKQNYLLPYSKTNYPNAKLIMLPNGLADYISSEKDIPESGTILSASSFIFQQEDQTADPIIHGKTIIRNIEYASLETDELTTFIRVKHDQTTQERITTLSVDTDTYLKINTLGTNKTIQIQTSSTNYIKLNTNPADSIELSSGATATEKMVLGETLNKFLSELLDKIEAMIIDTGVGPGVVDSSTVSQLETLRSQFLATPSGSPKKILSPNIKNN